MNQGQDCNFYDNLKRKKKWIWPILEQFWQKFGWKTYLIWCIFVSNLIGLDNFFAFDDLFIHGRVPLVNKWSYLGKKKERKKDRNGKKNSFNQHMLISVELLLIQYYDSVSICLTSFLFFWTIIINCNFI